MVWGEKQLIEKIWKTIILFFLPIWRNMIVKLHFVNADICGNSVKSLIIGNHVYIMDVRNVTEPELKQIGGFASI